MTMLDGMGHKQTKFSFYYCSPLRPAVRALVPGSIISLQPWLMDGPRYCPTGPNLMNPAIHSAGPRT